MSGEDSSEEMDVRLVEAILVLRLGCCCWWWWCCCCCCCCCCWWLGESGLPMDGVDAGVEAADEGIEAWFECGEVEAKYESPPAA